MKTLLIAFLTGFIPLSCWAYFSHIPLTKAAALEQKYDVGVTFKQTDDLVLVTVRVPRKDKEKVFVGFSVSRKENGKSTFVIRDLRGEAVSENHVSLTFQSSREEIPNTVVGAAYRQSKLGGNGWEYRINVESFFLESEVQDSDPSVAEERKESGAK